jgi:hypothetical protein
MRQEQKSGYTLYCEIEALLKSGSLPRAIYQALDKTFFAECYIRHRMTLDEESLCREPNSRHKKALNEDFFAEIPILGKNGLSAKRR